MEPSGTLTQPLLAQSSGNIAPAVSNVGVGRGKFGCILYLLNEPQP